VLAAAPYLSQILEVASPLLWLTPATNRRIQMGSNGLEPQATAYYKWVGTPSHSKFQMGWNSKPQLNSVGLELQAEQITNGLELQATANFEWVGTPSHS
jgi:hypothetical protein